MDHGPYAPICGKQRCRLESVGRILVGGAMAVCMGVAVLEQSTKGLQNGASPNRRTFPTKERENVLYSLCMHS